MNGMTKLSYVLSMIDRIPGLPVSAISATNVVGKSFPTDPSSWVFSAEPDNSDQWFIQIGVAGNGCVDHVLSLKVNGGVEDAAKALDMLNDHFKVAA